MISVVVPVYNASQYLDRCIESLVNQTIKDIEIILVDDGSTDNSLSISKTWSEKDERIIVLEQINRGVSSARNKGIEFSKGEFILLVDSDDWLPDGAIEFVIQEIENNPQVDVFSSVLQQYHEKDDSFHFTAYQGELFYSGLSYLEKKLPSGASPRFICKRTFLNQNNLRYIPGILHEDAVWGFMMLYKASLLKIIEKPIDFVDYWLMIKVAYYTVFMW